ncbi:hypothetical protein [Clostridium sp.]|uniref:hypothetical protein n=1 Tax=Clostridium sp. TaxID=1506 RepID=UPI0025C3103E|nr:hypothetical protein [Clostridium sp.]
MFEKRMTNPFKKIPADYIAGEELKIGMFVTIDHKTKEVRKAATADKVQGIVIRGSKVSFRNALGIPESIFDEYQATLPKGIKVGVFPFEEAERFATDVVDTAIKTVLDNEQTLAQKRTALIGKELTVVNGVLKEATAGNTVLAVIHMVDSEGFNNRPMNMSKLLNSEGDNITDLYAMKEHFVISYTMVRPYTK